MLYEEKDFWFAYAKPRKKLRFPINSTPEKSTFLNKRKSTCQSIVLQPRFRESTSIISPTVWMETQTSNEKNWYHSFHGFRFINCENYWIPFAINWVHFVTFLSHGITFNSTCFSQQDNKCCSSSSHSRTSCSFIVGNTDKYMERIMDISCGIFQHLLQFFSNIFCLRRGSLAEA